MKFIAWLVFLAITKVWRHPHCWNNNWMRILELNHSTILAFDCAFEDPESRAIARRPYRKLDSSRALVKFVEDEHAGSSQCYY
mmetsp:Transcript_17099/g.22259  ORF Transcript_17099/g.22259 Transcript_17099/m.22259 type:complete len:83 (-) Transcript_17099:16-264(-)